MGEFKRKTLPLAKIKANQQNPRVISESKLKKLINSLLVFPKMMSLRPITIDGDGYVIGGNMRQTALGRIAQMTFEELQAHIETLPEFNELPDGGMQVLTFWEQFLEKPVVEVQVARQRVEAYCAIGDSEVVFNYEDGKTEIMLFPDVVEQARQWLQAECNGSFERLAEWGLIR